MSWTEFIQYWGAIVATILAVIKIREFIRDRRQIHTTFSSDNEGKRIVVSCIGKNPVFVQNFFLYWRRNRYFGKKIDIDLTFHDDHVIERAMSIDKPLILVFKDENDFSTSHLRTKNKKLYLGLNIAGNRRPVILKV